MASLHLVIRWNVFVYRALLCSALGASIAAHAFRADVWLGASLYAVSLSLLAVELFKTQWRDWLGTWRLMLATAGAVALGAWGVQTFGAAPLNVLPLKATVDMSLSALSLLVSGGLMALTLRVPNRNPLLRMGAVVILVFLTDVLVFKIAGRGSQIDISSRLTILVIATLLSAWVIDASNFSKVVAASQGRAFDSLLGTLQTLAATSDVRLTSEQMLSLSTLAGTTTTAASGIGSLEDWQRLLDAAVILVPGAEGGSIRIRDGDGDFYYTAQSGFSDSLLGLRVNAQQAADWHGDLMKWHSGQARTVQHPFETRTPLDADPDFSPTETKRIRANLYFPVVVGDQVVAEINLDSFTVKHAFTEESITCAKQFAVQVAALVKAQIERGKLEARLREFEMLELITSALHDAHTPEIVAAAVVRETVRLLQVPNVAMMLMSDPLHTSLRLSSGLGLFADHVGTQVPWGHGLSWSALQSGETLVSHDIDRDPRAVKLSLVPSQKPLEQLTVPLLDSGGGALGTLLVSREVQVGFTQLDQRLIQTIARVAAGTLERVQVTRDLRLQVIESQNLLNLAQSLEGNDEQSLMNAVERVRLLGKADAAVITDSTGERVATRLQCGQLTPELQRALQAGVALSVANSLRLERTSFQVTNSHPPELRALMGQLGIAAAFTVVINDSHSLVLYRYAGDGWSGAERQTLEAAARMLGALVGRLGRLQSLENGYASALKTIGLALEMRDLETANHTERVAVLSEAVAEQLGVPASERLAIRWGAYLHDIGKFGVPDAILSKSTELSMGETAIMRQHPQLGFDLVRDLPFLPSTARDIVRYHHERWDGMGYPLGLTGEMIPLSARIFAVCDVFDALRSERPYKQALSLELSLLELHAAAERGHLEARLVNALQAVVQRDSQHLEQTLYPS